MKRHADRFGTKTDILTLKTVSSQSKVLHNINTITHNNIIDVHVKTRVPYTHKIYF